MNISEIKKYKKKIDIVGTVVEKTEIRDVVSRLDNTSHKVCEAKVEDDTGSIYITLWDETIDKIEVNKKYAFTNLYSSEFKDELRLNIGRFGEFKEA